MKTQLTDSEKQATIDAIKRFREQDPELAKQYEVEFVIAQFDENTLDELIDFLRLNNITYKDLRRIDSDLLMVIEMALDIDAVLSIESYLTFFANKNGFKYDGWGAFE